MTSTFERIYPTEVLLLPQWISGISDSHIMFWDEEDMSMDLPRSEYVTDDEIKTVQDEISRIEELLLQIDQTLRTDPSDEGARFRHRILSRQLQTRKEKHQTCLMDQTHRKLSRPCF